MPISFQIHPDFKLVVSKLSGHIRRQEFIDTYAHLFNRDDMIHDFNELADLREVTFFDVDFESFRQVSNMTKAFHGATEAFTAILVDHEINEVMVNLYNAVAANDGVEHVASFTEPRQATQWLGIPDFPLDLLDGDN